jgi:hypothetical protein
MEKYKKNFQPSKMEDGKFFEVLGSSWKLKWATKIDLQLGHPFLAKPS